MPRKFFLAQFFQSILECFLLNFDHFLATKPIFFMKKSLQIDCKTQFQYFNADPACFGTELPGSKTRPIESFLCLRRTLESRTRGRGGSDFQCPQRSGRSILSCSSKDLYIKKTYAWVFCAGIVVPSCARLQILSTCLCITSLFSMFGAIFEAI